MPKPIYVLGTGLSHDGSSCILKDGKILVAIEKERLTRIKHDGGSDAATVQYCLDAAGIKLSNIDLIVQCANFEKDEIKKNRFKGERIFYEDEQIPFVTISHHLAHAYSAVGTSPFNECAVMVIDGCGSFYPQCDDLAKAYIPTHVNSLPGLYGEKDSYYYFDGKQLQSLYKDFSIINFLQKPNEVYLPTSNHSIGGLYAMASNYCLGSFDDAGKLMGLAPFGEDGIYKTALFNLQDGNVWVNEEVMRQHFIFPMDEISHPFKKNFQHYANIAKWVQQETERAILYLFKHRLNFFPHQNICYAGGVALNAVANSKILQQTGIKNLYIEPAAGDNGLAIGCAYYGWMEVLKKEKVLHDGSTCFGKKYDEGSIEKALIEFGNNIVYQKENNTKDALEIVTNELLKGKTVAWYQQGAEFGPRALGRRSILADPRLANIQQHINANIKCREDFRPFAPVVLWEDRHEYFEEGIESEYMILIDKIKPEWKNIMPGIVHVDGTCRVQTIKNKEESLYKLLEVWKAKSGISVLLNTSFNKKGMPIIETPSEAIKFFYESALDVLVMHNFIVYKK